jgi:hypothetical protein
MIVGMEARSNMRSRGLGVLCVLGLAAVGCSDRPATEGPELLPAQLHGLQLIEAKSGEDAAGMIARLHKQDVAPRASEIGVYEAQGIRAELYVSVFQSADETMTQFEAMVAAINEGVPGFGHHTHFDVTGRDVHVVFGDGRINYFYTDGEKLTWLGVQQPMIARAALAELLSVEVDSIPSLPGMPRPQQQQEGERS